MTNLKLSFVNLTLFHMIISIQYSKLNKSALLDPKKHELLKVKKILLLQDKSILIIIAGFFKGRSHEKKVCEILALNNSLGPNLTLL
jgi:hypothetical protein